MFDQEYFALRILRVKYPEAWSPRADGLCFVFPTEGAGQYLKNSSAQRLLPGDVMIWNTAAEGKLSAAKGGEMVFGSFSLRLEHLWPLFAADEISVVQEVTDNLKSSKLFPASTPLAVICHKLVDQTPLQFDLEHRSHLLQVAATVLNEQFKSVHQRRAGLSQVEGRIIQTFEQLSVEQVLNLSIDELATRFGCSRRHLNRLFHQYFSFSVGALKMEMRLLKAVSLLRDANAKVINVAAQCGFNHLGLFNTCFKRRFGVSPGRWRKQAAFTEPPPVELRSKNAVCPLQGKGLCPMSFRAANSKTSLPSDASRIGKSPDSTVLPPADAGQPGVQPGVLMSYRMAPRTTPLTV